jgi:putative ABC transport system permease protein
VLNDLRLAIRALLKTPLFTLAALAALALAIGANAAVFGLVNQLLLRPAGIVDPERVVAVQVRYGKLGLSRVPLSVPDFGDVAAARSTFEHAALANFESFNYTGGGIPIRLLGAQVSQQWFDVFGARPEMGRTFRGEEDRPNVNTLVILSWKTWQGVFGGASDIVGRALILNGKPYRVVGVMPRTFAWPREADIWVPRGLAPDAFGEDNRFEESYTVVARLRPGLTVAHANAAVQLAADRVRSGSGEGPAFARDSLWGMFAVPMTDFIAGDTRTPVLVLLAAVGFVLLVACSNIAGLTIARTAERARDRAVRSALGATRWLMVRQTIAESAALAATGGAAGLALAIGGMHLLVALAPQDAVTGLGTRVDLNVLLFTGGVTLAGAALFSIIPALQGWRGPLFESLKAGGRPTAGGPAHRRLRSALVVAETALAVVLLAGAGLFLRSLANTQRVDPGFDPRGVITASLSLPATRYPTPESRWTFYNAAIERLGALPGASNAALAILVPFHDSDMTGSFTIAGRVTRPGDPGAHGRLRVVTPGYFPALRIPLKRGRLLTEHDRAGTLPVVVVDENLAREYWPGEDPVGRQIRRGAGPGDGPWQTIVGVVGNVKHSSLSEDLSKGTIYYSLFQEAVPFATIVVRSRADTGLLARAIPRAVAGVDAAQPVFDVRSLEEDVLRSLAPQRFVAQLLVFFAAAALFMAGLGLYAVVSYSVTQRVREIGIRMALGAPRASVLRHVVGEGLRLAGFGAAAGLAVAAAIARLLTAQLFGVGSMDPTALASTVAILLTVALAATYWPARRASRVDPIVALRAE